MNCLCEMTGSKFTTICVAHQALCDGDTAKLELQIDELKRQQKADVYVMGEISKCRDEAFRQVHVLRKALEDIRACHVANDFKNYSMAMDAIASVALSYAENPKCEHEWVIPDRTDIAPGSVCKKCRTPWMPGMEDVEKRDDEMAEAIKAEITCPKCKTACCVTPRDENRYWCDYCGLTFVLK